MTGSVVSIFDIMDKRDIANIIVQDGAVLRQVI
jgi:hypothetical protein